MCACDQQSAVKSKVAERQEGFVAQLTSSSLLRDFQHSLIQHGICRVLVFNSCCVKIAWNAVDPKTGSLKSEDFCYTQASFVEGVVIGVKCDCRVYAESLNLYDGVQAGVCPHGIIFSVAMACAARVANPIDTGGVSTDVFERFLMEQFLNRSPVTVLHHDHRAYKFLVVVDEREAVINKTSQLAICRMERIGEKCYVCCGDFRCKRGKMKSVKTTNSMDSLCIHLQTIGKDEVHGQVMKCIMEVTEAGKLFAQDSIHMRVDH